MSDLRLDPVPQTPARTFVMMVVGWWLVAIGWGLVGLIVAGRGWRDAPDASRDNYRYMVRTVFIGVVYSAPALVVYLLDAPLPLVAAFAIPILLWHATRCFRGLIALVRDRPLTGPRTWLV